MNIFLVGALLPIVVVVVFALVWVARKVACSSKTSYSYYIYIDDDGNDIEYVKEQE